MKMIERNVTVKLDITPEELAKEFADMSSVQQAEFFNALAIITSEWENSFCMQLQYITDEKILTRHARQVMQEIGQYSCMDLAAYK